MDRIVALLSHVHRSLDYELSPMFDPWAWRIEHLYQQRILEIERLYRHRDKLLNQLKEYRR